MYKCKEYVHNDKYTNVYRVKSIVCERERFVHCTIICESCTILCVNSSVCSGQMNTSIMQTRQVHGRSLFFILLYDTCLTWWCDSTLYDDCTYFMIAHIWWWWYTLDDDGAYTMVYALDDVYDDTCMMFRKELLVQWVWYIGMMW